MGFGEVEDVSGALNYLLLKSPKMTPGGFNFRRTGEDEEL